MWQEGNSKPRKLRLESAHERSQSEKRDEFGVCLLCTGRDSFGHQVFMEGQARSQELMTRTLSLYCSGAFVGGRGKTEDNQKTN